MSTLDPRSSPGSPPGSSPGSSRPVRSEFRRSQDRPLLIQESETDVYRIETSTDARRIRRSLTGRDAAVLVALHHYRYLDLLQLEALFFTNRRQAQERAKLLRDLGLVHRWTAHLAAGWRALPSIFVISERGATVVAAILDAAPGPILRRGEHARSHAVRFVHDLEANGFFVGLAAASRDLPGQGLYHWMGEEGCRQLHREQGSAITPDGWGRYVVQGGEVIFLLEWDRGTESIRKVAAKARAYLKHFQNRHHAGLSHVLFVAPGEAREEAIRSAVERLLPWDGRGCRFWTATADRLDARGSLAPIWRRVDGKTSEPTSLPEMPSHPRTARWIDDCIGKPGWWERRPGGGEGA